MVRRSQTVAPSLQIPCLQGCASHREEESTQPTRNLLPLPHRNLSPSKGLCNPSQMI